VAEFVAGVDGETGGHAGNYGNRQYTPYAQWRGGRIPGAAD